MGNPSKTQGALMSAKCQSTAAIGGAAKGQCCYLVVYMKYKLT